MASELPIPATPMLGRAAEMAGLERLLEGERVRLITLTGAGGSGKSRLAIELAIKVEDAFDRVWFVDLTQIDDAELLPTAFGEALGIQESGTRELLAIVPEMLSVGRFMVVLDNFEHVIAAADYVASVLAACRDLVVVVTSREALGVRAERVFQVEPLATPTRGEYEDIAALRKIASIELFEERARAARPGFELTDADVPIVAEICLDLDGLPLAIELVAAQSSVLSPREILSRLSTRAPLVTSGPRDLPARHRTLDATVEWSYDLLAPPERELFRLAGVFSGGFTTAAISALSRLDGDVLVTLAQLVNKNLIRVASGGEGASRYWLLDTIRVYALDRLREAGELDAAQHAQAEFYVGLAEELRGSMRGPTMAAALDALAADYSNFRAVFQWSAAHQAWAYGLRLAGALYLFWNARGHLSEARTWLEMALEHAHDVDPEVRAAALNAAGVMAGMQLDHQRATLYFTESLALWEQLGNVPRQATVSNNLGLVAKSTGQLEQAATRFELAEQLHAQAGDRVGEANAVGSRARVARDMGQLDLAFELLQRCLELCRSIGDDWGTANSLANLGHVAIARGDVDRARQAFRESLVMRRGLGNVLHIAECLEGLAEVAERDEPRLAVRLLGAAAAMRETSGAPVPVAEEQHHAQLEDRVRRRLSAVMFKAGWNAGRALTVEAAIGLALRDAPLPPEPAAQKSDDLDRLSGREREIARLIAGGYSNRAIADSLVLSPKTVETHVKHIFTKLNVRNRSALAVLVSRTEADS